MAYAASSDGYGGELIHEAFEAQVALRPQALALAHLGDRLTYAELNDRAERIASRLVETGLLPDQRVAIVAERGVDAVVALLGVLKAGGCYVPMDPSYPPERLRFMLQDCQPVAVLTQPALQALVAASAGSAPPPMLLIDGCTGSASGVVPARARGLHPGNLAYVIYTSGSTGTPKGVMIEHRSVINLWHALEEGIFGNLKADARVGLNAPLSFDASVKSLTQLLSGRSVLIVPQAARSDSAELCRFISSNELDAIDCTPLQLELLIAAGLLDPSSRKPAKVLVGGDSIAAATWAQLRSCTEVEFFNVYGPTECTVDASIGRIRPLDERPHIGRAIRNASIHLLDEAMQPVPAGHPGELWIGGVGVARGYLGRPELTAERFLADPFSPVEGARLYRSGDRARLLADGNLDFLGRQDFQLKVRGFRIEPGEIEAALRTCPGVRETVVVSREDRPGDMRLVAYFVPSDPNSPGLPAVRRRLSEMLPEFMLPHHYVVLDELPQTAHGKVDRASLPAPSRDRPEQTEPFEPARTDDERQVCRIFADVLAISELGRNDNFFECGGNSLLALRALALVQAGFGRPVAATLLFSNPTPAQFAHALRSGSSGLDSARLPRAMRAGGSLRGDADRNEPVAIIAMAGRFPGAANIEQFWENLCAGRDSITQFGPDDLDASVSITDRLDPSYVRARGIIDDVESFDAAFFGISPREAELMDPQHRVFLELCWECMERAGEVPDASPAPVGVFAGAYHSSYFRRHVEAHPEKVEKVGAFQVMLGNEKDYISTRVANKLNLTGPAISMVTGCSTSLVAIAQALDSLQSGKCDMALAGGVAITCPPRSGYRYLEGAMLSPDGHTRPFDAGAQGTVFSDGAGVVLLKRLSDALRDGNPVHAVLLGGAINNDGGGKASFTAPSSEGQAAVISAAQANARVSARSISYIETHGTATPLGDPIEIEGLATAFGRSTRDVGFCRIGSVKSNIGHTVIAAGAAGVIKTALALEHRQLPATVHFESINPRLGLEGSAFVVNAGQVPWPDDGKPLRAGVSSFGVGGTNAHVVMEQAPDIPDSDPGAGPQLLVLSARTQSALSASAARLAGFLEGQPATSTCILADTAWTLGSGRKRFAHRAALVADDIGEAIEQLRSPGLAASIKRGKPAKSRSPVFMFPGQGSHYAGMGRALHETEPAFAAAFDECVEALRDGLSLDLRPLLFGDDAEALLPTAIMQPAIFCIEYALARWWMSRGVVPVAMLGHSIGEFAAATIAGVFRPADAACLVARRGALMQALPAGAMLSVKLPAAQLQERLGAGLSLAVENAPGSCVAAGPCDAVAALRGQLEGEGVACRELRTSHAFHSEMMDPVVEPFRALVEAVPRHPPRVPMISASSGGWLDDATAMSADYWAQHLRGPVRFGTAVGAMIERDDSAVMLEVGPRNTLCGLVRQHPAGQASGAMPVASLGDAPGVEKANLRLAVGQLWCQGVDVDPTLFDHRVRRRLLEMPTYPFERQRFWVDAAPVRARATSMDGISDQGAQQEVHAADAVEASQLPIGKDMPAPVLARLDALFGEVTGFAISREDHGSNFMELGLDSLMLTQMTLQVQKAFKVKIGFRDLMGECSSLERLAARIIERMPDTGVAAAPGARLGRAPDGTPAWFIPNPEQPGKYLRIDS